MRPVRITFEFWFNLALGLLVGYIFNVIISGGIYGLVTNDTHYQDYCGSKEIVELVNQGRLIALWHSFSALEYWLYGVLGLNIVRMIHSFILLQKDGNYHDLVSAPGRGRRLHSVQFVAQLLVIGSAVVAVPRFGKSYSDLYGWIAMLVLIIWDAPAFYHLKHQPANRFNDLRRTFTNWMCLDVTIIVLGLLVLATSSIVDAHASHVLPQSMKQAVIMGVSALLLTLLLIMDYVVLNHSFYWPLQAVQPPQAPNIQVGANL